MLAYWYSNVPSNNAIGFMPFFRLFVALGPTILLEDEMVKAIVDVHHRRTCNWDNYQQRAQSRWSALDSSQGE